MSKNSTAKQELSPNERTLLEYYKKDQPVLLYGNDSIDLEELIERIKGICCPHNQYIDLEELTEAEQQSLIEAAQLTTRYIDCGDMNGKEVYEALVESRFELLWSGERPLFEGYGDLIIDNLPCRANNDEDDKWYRKLGKIIRYRQIGNIPTNFGWLVARTHDPKPFPTYFLKPFGEPILLDGVLKESIIIDRINALEEIDKESKAEIGQSRGGLGQVDKKDITSKILFMDDKHKALYFDKKTIAVLKPEEINLIKYMQKEKQEVFELEQILIEHFKIKLTKPYKHSKNISDIISGNSAKPTIEEKSKAISKCDRNKFEVYKANINKKCGMLSMGELIQNVKRGTKAFKLSRKIEINYLSLNEFLNSNKI